MKSPTKTTDKSAWKAHLSAAHRGPKPGKQRVQKAPKTPSWSKVRF